MKSPDGKAAVNSSLQLLVGGNRVSIIPVGDVLGTPTMVGVMPEGLLTMGFTKSETTGDMEVRCRVLPYDDENPLTPRVCDFELHLAVDSPRIMFRPHIDWYTADHGPNVPALANGHNSATRMLAIQTDQGTIAMVPSTDNLTWGFGKNNEMICRFHVPLRPADGLQRQIFRPIDQGPTQFTITLPLVAGDWWDAYRHVVGKVFKFEQPRQWAMPITQMQMLAARYSMRAEVWSEKWQTVRSHPGIDFFYNFYGMTYNIPSLYSWYLVSDDTTARTKAEKQVELLVRLQEQTGPVAGAWFSMYCVEGNPLQMVGRDQAFNRWIVPHATGTSAKTLLWYWEASGKKDGRAFAAARRGCDWLLSIQRPDGLWPYALDLEGRPVSELAGAGQIWCTWALWKMYEFTGDTRYRDAAIRSKDAFKQTFMNLHRYTGYWEDVSGANGKVSPSWEGYEPAIATLVFTDMGEQGTGDRGGQRHCHLELDAGDHDTGTTRPPMARRPSSRCAAPRRHRARWSALVSSRCINPPAIRSGVISPERSRRSTSVPIPIRPSAWWRRAAGTIQIPASSARRMRTRDPWSRPTTARATSMAARCGTTG